MKTLFTLAFFLAIQFALFAQTPISSTDIIPDIGDKWLVFFSTGGDEAFDIHLGANGPNSTFDFSAYQNTTELFTGLTFDEIDENNANSTIEIVDGLDLMNIPAVFESADYYLNYSETTGANWYMPFAIQDDELHILGEMAITGASTPPEWTYYFGTHFGPGRNIPFDMVLGDSVVMERYEIEVTPDGMDSIHIIDVYFFDAEGEFISPTGETYSDVCRLLHASNIEIYTQENGAWNFADQVAQDFIEYRKRGYQMPLLEVGVGYYGMINDNIVSSWDIDADFYIPTFVLSSLGKKVVSLEAQVSPNPAQDFISIQFSKELQLTNISWKDNLGREVDYLDYNNTTARQLMIDTPNEAGIYFLEVNTTEGRTVKKILIE